MNAIVPIEWSLEDINFHDSRKRLLRQFALVRKILDDSQEMEWPKRKQYSANVDFWQWPMTFRQDNGQLSTKVYRKSTIRRNIWRLTCTIRSRIRRLLSSLWPIVPKIWVWTKPGPGPMGYPMGYLMSYTMGYLVGHPPIFFSIKIKNIKLISN